MKQIIFWAAFFLLLLGVNCQLEEIPPIAKTFKKQVRVSDFNGYLAGIYQRSKIDSNYHVVISTPSGAATVLLNKDGIKTGDMTTYTNVATGIVKAFSDGNDGFFLIGEKVLGVASFPPPVQPFFAHIIASGSALYKEFEMGTSPQNSNLYDAVMTSKGTVMACGSYYSETTEDYDVVIIELDDNANIRSGFPKSMKKHGYRGTGIVEKASGGFMMTAASWKNFFPFVNNSFVLSFSENYSPNPIPWELQIPEKDWTQQSPRLSGIERVGGNTFVISDGGVYARSNYLAGIDADFNAKWEKIEEHGILKILRTSDGNFVVLGNTDTEIFLTKRASDTGAVIWSESYAETSGGTLQAVTVSETHDKGFIIGGNYTKDGKTDIYVIKTDGLGKVHE